MSEATNISLPSTQRVREILREVQDVTVEGAVFTRRGRRDYEAIPADEVRGGQVPVRGVDNASGGHWLLYRLLHEYLPSTAPDRHANLMKLNLFSSANTIYNNASTCREMPPALRTKAAVAFAQGDEMLRGELEQAFAVVPEQRASLIRARLLKAEPLRVEPEDPCRPVAPSVVRSLRQQYSAQLQAQMGLAGLEQADVTSWLKDCGLASYGNTIYELVHRISSPTPAIADAIVDLLKQRHQQMGHGLPESFDDFCRLSRTTATFRLVDVNAR